MTTSISGTGGITFPSTSVQGDTAIGYGQTWQNVLASRSSGVAYTNSTTKPIQVSVQAASTGTGATTNGVLSVNVNGVGLPGCAVYAAYSFGNVSFIVPPGNTYSVTATNVGIAVWAELR